MKITVPVTFNGEVEVDVPDRLSKEDQLALALQLALCRCTVVTSGNDTPEADAFDDYAKDGNATGDEWDNAELSVGGMWSGDHSYFGKSDDQPELDISFLAQGHFNQTIRITEPGLSPEIVLKALQDGSALTTVNEGGDILLIRPRGVDGGLNKVGIVVNSESNCEYTEYEENS